ncbi:hypothetical protein ACLN6N_00540 [Sphingomonas carotinifaciens]|uniref:hypothetical protein n=1 Tax=Sphingomonas carotinifaciens TaxID=1166323 RepID=UPI0039A2DCEE
MHRRAAATPATDVQVSGAVCAPRHDVDHEIVNLETAYDGAAVRTTATAHHNLVSAGAIGG